MLQKALLCVVVICQMVIGDSFEGTGYCYTEYVHVSVVKQVPSYSKHCTKECKTIKDVECRIVNLDKHGKYLPKKICADVPTQKCVPVPVKIEAEKCVNVPTQTCENVPVIANVPVPQKQCFRKPRKVCQTLVSTKPKVVVERIPKTVCPHDQPLAAKSPSIPKISPVISPVVQKKPGPKFVKSPDLKKPISHSHNHPHRIDDELLQSAGSYPQKVYLETDHVDVGDVTNPVYDEYPEFPEPKQIPESAYKYPQGTYKNQEIPIFEEPNNYIGHSNKYEDDLDHIDLDEEETNFDYEEYKSNANSHADILHEYFKHLNHNYQQQQNIYNNPNNGNFYSSPSIDRTDNTNINVNDPPALFAGDIGGESGIIKRDSNSREEPMTVSAIVSQL